MRDLLAAVKKKDEEAAYHWTKSEEWATTQQLMEATGNKRPHKQALSAVPQRFKRVAVSTPDHLNRFRSRFT